MKKLLLLVAVLLATNVNAQFSEYGCGWVFRSTENSVTFKGKKTTFNNGHVEVYYDSDCKGDLHINYADGTIEKFYFKTKDYKKSGYNKDGDYYQVFDMFEFSTGNRVIFQIIKSSEPYIRLIYSNGYTELSI
jgi:hypothetical protein